MAATLVGFRWLDILEKEFDEAFVDLDVLIGDLDAEDPDVVNSARQKMATLSSCFAQLSHKAQTVFQNSAKVEAELVYLRAELIDAKAQNSVQDQELHTLLLQLHACQLQHLPGVHTESDAERIRRRLEEELQQSPTHQRRSQSASLQDIIDLHGHSLQSEDGMQLGLMEVASLRSELSQLQSENTALRNTLLALHSELYGAQLMAKYLDKELAGRIQQLQLLGREMQGDMRDKLWRQLESEILLHRRKTVVRTYRNKVSGVGGDNAGPTSEPPSSSNHHGVCEPRFITVQQEAGEGLGISITGGRAHGLPILISELEPDGPAAKCRSLYVGDAILSANGQDLKEASLQEAVDILESQMGDICLEVQYVAVDDSDEENSLGEDMYGFRYRFFDDEVLDSGSMISLHPLQNGYTNSRQNGNNHVLLSTPTAPRTPESPNRNTSDCSLPASPVSMSAGRHDSILAASVQHPTNTVIMCSSNSVSYHSDVNCSNTNTDVFPQSPMHVSTDGSHMGRSSTSEESLEKSPVKQRDSYYEENQTSVSIPSTPNNNTIDNRDVTYKGDNFETNINSKTADISTLQQTFGKANSASSMSVECRNQTSEEVNNVKFKQDIGETIGANDAKFSDKSPVRLSEDAVPVKAVCNVHNSKSVDVASKSPTKPHKQDKKDKELVMTEPMSNDSSSSAAGDGSSRLSPAYHRAGRKAVNRASSCILQLSNKGHRSGKAHRMVPNVEESSTNSSFDEEQMVSHHKIGSAKRRDRSLRNVAEASVLAVGNSPTHSSSEHRRVADRVVVDNFGDPDFGTPV